jgi:glycosyltransferase involved in cell wall biosynthesis
MGHEVIVSSFYGLSGAPTQWNGITVLPGFGANYCSVSLYEHCKVIKPDLVVTLGDVWVLDPQLLGQLPIAHWLPADSRPMSTADRNFVEAAGVCQLMAMSRFGFDRFADAGFDPVYCPHGIDLDVFRFSQDRDESRQRMDLDGRFVIGLNMANNDAIRKALPEIMVAFAKFHNDRPDSLLSLHSCVHQDGGQDLEFLAESLGITDVCRVVDQYSYSGGLISDQDMAQWYGVIDVLCATSYAEGFGLPIMEAQACGVPVITTNASAMSELNPHGIGVDGIPFYNGVHRAWWLRPDIRGIYEAFHQAYENKDSVDRKQLRDFAAEYEVNTVAEKYMGPAIEELGRRMESRRNLLGAANAR